jgi:hypothetical protein
MKNLKLYLIVTMISGGILNVSQVNADFSVDVEGPLVPGAEDERQLVLDVNPQTTHEDEGQLVEHINEEKARKARQAQFLKRLSNFSELIFQTEERNGKKEIKSPEAACPGVTVAAAKVAHVIERKNLTFLPLINPDVGANVNLFAKVANLTSTADLPPVVVIHVQRQENSWKSFIQKKPYFFYLFEYSPKFGGVKYSHEGGTFKDENVFKILQNRDGRANNMPGWLRWRNDWQEMRLLFFVYFDGRPFLVVPIETDNDTFAGISAADWHSSLGDHAQAAIKIGSAVLTLVGVAQGLRKNQNQ